MESCYMELMLDVRQGSLVHWAGSSPPSPLAPLCLYPSSSRHDETLSLSSHFAFIYSLLHPPSSLLFVLFFSSFRTTTNLLGTSSLFSFYLVHFHPNQVTQFTCLISLLLHSFGCLAWVQLLKRISVCQVIHLQGAPVSPFILFFRVTFPAES